MANFIVLNEEEQDDIIVSFMQAQERDKFCHELNLSRYEAMLTTELRDDFRNKITQLKDETLSRLEEVDAIIAATRAQIPNSSRINAAKTRLRNNV